MGIFRQFPYTNFHELNLDELIKMMREMQDEWAATKTEWASYKDFIDNYFATLDVSEEVLAALRTLAASGELNRIIDPTIATETAAWLTSHITPTTPPVDASLSIAGAAADAKAAGDALALIRASLNGAMGMYNLKWQTGGVNGNTGNLVNNDTDIRTVIDSVQNGERFYLINPHGRSIYIFEYDEDQTFVRRSSAITSRYYPYTLGSTTKYIRLCITNVAGNIVAANNIVLFRMSSDQYGAIMRRIMIPESENFYENGSTIQSIQKATIVTVNNTRFIDMPDGINGAILIKTPYQGSLTGYYLEMLYTYNPTQSRGNIYLRISNSSTIYFDWMKVLSENDFKLVTKSTSENALADYNNIYEVPFGFISITGASANFNDYPDERSDTNGLIIHQPYQGANVTTGYYLDIYMTSSTRFWGETWIRLSNPSGTIARPWNRITHHNHNHPFINYVAFGDSIMYGYNGKSRTEYQIPDAVAGALGLDVTNAAVSGTGWLTDASSTGTTGGDKLYNYDLTDVDLITVNFGINDYLSNTAALNEIITKANNVINHIITNYPSCRIIIISPIISSRRGNVDSDYAYNTNGSGGYTLGELVDALETIANRYKIPYINCEKICPINAYNVTDLLEDQLHPNDDGYKTLCTFFEAQIGSYYRP